MIVHLDTPADGILAAPASLVRGWIAGSDGRALVPLSLVNADQAAAPVSIVDRPDVRTALPDVASAGFSGWIDARAGDSSGWRLRYESSAGIEEVALPLHADDAMLRRFDHTKATKLQRLRPLLRCPRCRLAFDDQPGFLVCGNGHRFPATANAYDFLDGSLRAQVGVLGSQSISAHQYDPSLNAMIAASRGPILDVGAGLRPDYREDVFNLEIVAYPTTDVVAVSESLPFADDTFDLIISVAVLEHVVDPFAAAAELVRIMRPGGRIFAAVPFLQPYHGYPDHYYNMTSNGLRHLFAELDVESVSVPASGHPIFALTWILRWWHDALPSEVAAAFADLRIRDLLTEPVSLFGAPFVDLLPPRSVEELAALNVLIGRKRG